MNLVFVLVASHFLEFNPITRERAPVYASEPNLEGDKARHYAVAGYAEDKWVPWVVEVEFGESVWDVRLRAMMLAEDPCATRAEAQEVCERWSGTKWAEKLDSGFRDPTVPELLAGWFSDLTELSKQFEAADAEQIVVWLDAVDAEIGTMFGDWLDCLISDEGIDLTKQGGDSKADKVNAVREHFASTRQVTN